MALINKARLALRVRTEAFDPEIADLIAAAKLDLKIAGVVLPKDLDPLCERAIITYVKLHFGDLEEKQAARLQASYDAQKGQLAIATGYTDWGGANNAG